MIAGPKPLLGMTLVLTGTLPNLLGRDDAKDLIEAAGGKVIGLGVEEDALRRGRCRSGQQARQGERTRHRRDRRGRPSRAARRRFAVNDAYAALRLRGHQPPLRERLPLALGKPACIVGSIEPALAQRMAEAGLPITPSGRLWCVVGEGDASLAAIARWLDENRLAARWRGELLAVTDDDGMVHGAIERAAVRPLGITTHAVHLVGRRADGRVWIQQRALDKATDPGCGTR